MADRDEERRECPACGGVGEFLRSDSCLVCGGEGTVWRRSGGSPTTREKRIIGTAVGVFLGLWIGTPAGFVIGSLPSYSLPMMLFSIKFVIAVIFGAVGYIAVRSRT
ncbi:hypothetical protein ACEU6E_09270 [Halorutilales archaeon Cl-col2-1]